MRNLFIAVTLTVKTFVRYRCSARLPPRRRKNLLK